MALTVKTDWKPQDTVSPAHFNRVEGNIGSLESSVAGLSTSKVDKVAGKGLSTNDFNNTYVNKITNLESSVTNLGTVKLDASQFTSENIAQVVSSGGGQLDAVKLNGQFSSYYAKASDVSTHIANKANPHTVTKSQVGLANVNNYSDASAPEIVSGTANRYVTASALSVAISSMKSGDSGKLNGQLANYYAPASTLTAHTGNKSNPHGVTKAQVGLSLVNNYQDATASQIVAGTASRYATASAVKGAISSMKSGDSAKLNGQSASYYARATLSGTGAPPSTLASGVIYIQY